MRSMSCTAATQVESQPSVSAAAEATGGLRAGGGLPGNVTEASAMEQLALAIWDPGARAECARAPPAARRSRDLGARAPTPAPALTQCLPGSRGEAGPHGRAGRAGHAQGGHQERARTLTLTLVLAPGPRAGCWRARARRRGRTRCCRWRLRSGAARWTGARPWPPRRPAATLPAATQAPRLALCPPRGRALRAARAHWHAAAAAAAHARRAASRAGRARARAGRRAQARRPGGRHEPLPPAAVLSGVPLRRAPALARRAAAPGPAPRPRARALPPAPR